MRKLFILILLQMSFAGFAQTKPASKKPPFKVTIAAGYALPTYQVGNTDYIKGGLVYAIEPQYELFEKLDVGLRYEQAFVQRPEYLDKVLAFPTQTNSIMSAVLTGNYVITTSGTFRPYVGAGVGLYYAAQSTPVYQTTSYPLPTTTSLGGLLRAGVKYGHAHLEAAYNLVGATTVKTAATGLTMTAQNSYATLKIGITMGGSR